MLLTGCSEKQQIEPAKEVWYTPTPDVFVANNKPPMRAEELSCVETFNGIKGCPWSIDTQKEISAWCNRYGVSFHLIMSIAYQESHFDTDAVGDDGQAWGAWQIHCDTWEDVITKFGYTDQDMFDPVKAGRVCAYIMKAHFNKVDDAAFAVMAWNGGSQYALHKTDSGEITKYATDILKRSQKWEGE